MADIVLKDRDGKDIEYNSVNLIKIPTPNGDYQYFVKGKYSVDTLPTLYPPSAVSSVTTANNSYFTVTNPYTKNGMFPKMLQILALPTDSEEYIVVAEVALSTTTYTSSVRVYGKDFNRTVFSNNVIARFTGDGFQESDVYISSSTYYSVFQILYSLLGVNANTSPEFAYSIDTLIYTLTPHDSYYLPKTIDIIGVGLNGDTFTPEYDYNPDTGSLTITGVACENMTVKVNAVQIPWLRDPTIALDNELLLLSVGFIDSNATATYVITEGDKTISVADERTGMLSWDFTSIGSYQSGQEFTLQSNGYYRATCATRYSWSVARVDFDMKTEATITIDWTRYIGNYNYYSSHYGIISNVDTVLSSSYSEDASSKIYTKCGTGSMSTNQNSHTTITIPAGKHFLYFKYIHPTYGGTGYFQFKISTPVAEFTTYDLTNYFPYGTYTIHAQSEAYGYTNSDLVEIGTFTFNPVISILDNKLTVSNRVPDNVTSFECYIDGTLADTVKYDSSGDWYIDLSLYVQADNTEHTIYIAGIGTEVEENQSNILTYTVIE